MRIKLPRDLAPDERARLRDRVRVALGPHLGAIRAVDLGGAPEADGFEARLRLRLHAGEQIECRAWQSGPRAALELVLARCRRAIDRRLGQLR